MKIFIRLYVLLLIALITASSALTQTQGGVDILLAKARSLELRGLTDLAAENWRKVLLVNSNQTEALAGLARAAKENDKTDEERIYLTRLRKIDPKNPEITAIEQMHVFTPQERSRLDEAGRLAARHKPDEAMRIYNEVFANRTPPPGPWTESFFQTEAASTGGRAKAISQLRHLSAQNPDIDTYRLWLASLLTYDPGTRMEGLRILESIKDAGSAQQAKAPWRQTLLWEKENPEILHSIEAYLQRYPDPGLQPIEAELRAKQQQKIADSEKSIGFRALRSKDVGTATAKFSEVLRTSPNDVNAMVGLAYARLDQKRFSEALSLFDRAHALAPQRQDAREGYDDARYLLALQQGATAQQRNQPEAAVMAYRQALALRSMDKDAKLGLANSLLKERKFPDAEAQFHEVLAQSPNDAEAIAGLGFVKLEQKRFDEAAKFLVKAHQLAPGNKDIDAGYRNAAFWDVMNQAAVDLKANRFKQAIAEYQQALTQNPNSRDALMGIANASVEGGDFRSAAKTYYRLTAGNPNDSSAWMGLIKAQMGEKAPEAAISTVQQIPVAMKQQLESRSDYLSELALVYFEANQPERSEQYLQRALAVPAGSDSDDAVSSRVQLAGRFMERGKTGRAIEIYKQATQSHPGDPSGWEGLVGAYTRAGSFQEAMTTVRSMPQGSFAAAVKDSGFLDSVAVLYSNQGQCAEAEDLLQKSLAIDQRAGRQPAESTQLQLADIWIRQHNYSHARDLYSGIVAKDANSSDAWRGYLAVLHQQGDDRTLVSQIPRMPGPVRSQLEADPSFLILEASAYSTVGQKQDSLRMLQQARSRYTAQGDTVPAVLDLQTAWTMLSLSADTPGLSEILNSDLKRSDLTPKQRARFERVYSELTVQRAQAVFERAPDTAISILAEAAGRYPGDRNINSALASMYLNRHDKQKALELFKSWDMRGAEPGDYRVAAGAALSAHKDEIAEQYLRRGLQAFPHDAELMHMLARQEIASGNYEQGERELRSALVAVREQQTGATPAAAPAPAVRTSTTEIASSSSTNTDEAEGVPACKPEGTRGANSEARIRPMSLIFSGRYGRRAHLMYAALQEPQEPQQPRPPQQPAPPDQEPQPHPSGESQQAPSQTTGPAQTQQQEEKMQDEVEAVENRNTPLVNFGGVGTGRIGDPGFDQLIIGDILLGGVYTAADRVRFGIEGHGIYAYSGTPDGGSSLMFGTLPAGAQFKEQVKSGYSGIAQLSTDTFGMMFGTTPQGFAIHNLIGGLRFRPMNRWFTFEGVRDSVKDSLLSYAGAVDPGTGIRWGGVVANSGTVRFDSAPSTNVRYKTIGEYASGTYSLIQGSHVPDNWSIAGNAGLYWQIVQGLTIGVNANGMHYDRNLKYFSFGQGGYFSPQEFYLLSMPIAWYSRHPRFEYELRFSGGAQYLHEGTSLFYPVQPGSAVLTQGAYGSNNSISPNYDASIRMGYRVAPHLYFDAFATANNSRDYYTQSAGFNLRFMIDRVPTSTDLRVNAIPDWTGKQSFSAR